MEHRLLEGGFILDEIKSMSSTEVVNRYSAYLYMDELRKGEVEDEWSHLALTK